MSLDIQNEADHDVSSEIAEHCLLTRTRQISRVLTAIYDEALRPFGINASQFSLLVLIVEFGPISRADLGRKNHQDRSTLTRNLQPLISQEWVFEGAPESNGRSRPLSLTGQGKTLLRSAAPASSTAQARPTSLSRQLAAHAL